MTHLRARIKERRDARKARRFYRAVEHGVVTRIERASINGFSWVNVDVDSRDGMVFAYMMVPSAIAKQLRIDQGAVLSVEFEDASCKRDEGGDS